MTQSRIIQTNRQIKADGTSYVFAKDYTPKGLESYPVKAGSKAMECVDKCYAIFDTEGDRMFYRISEPLIKTLKQEAILV